MIRSNKQAVRKNIIHTGCPKVPDTFEKSKTVNEM